MDLSFNKIKAVQQLKDQQSFKGIKGEFNKNNRPVYKFTPPPYDPEIQKVSLEFAVLDYDAYKSMPINPKKADFIQQEFKPDTPLRISQDALRGKKAIAYRFIISQKDGKSEDKYFVDDFEKINTSDTKEEYTLIEFRDGYRIDPKKGPMRHSFLDADAIVKKADVGFELEMDNKHQQRSHFNKLGGSSKGLIELLKAGELDPYRYILSTPDIGNDQTSSHGYWPNNLYQTHNMQDFKDLNYELFARGKGYVADGAFTSQSLQSPMFQHVLKWGKKSPFYNMFKVDDHSNLVLGVLPNDIIENGNDQAIQHVGVRIVNNPASDSYDANKPVLLQFFDDRLSSKEQRNNTEQLISAYDKTPNDIFEITHNDDSVYPFYFELNPKTMSDKIKLFKNKNYIMLKDIKDSDRFLDFGNFEIGRREDAGGATFWDGNRDIVKLNLSNPNPRKPENVEGMYNARKYLYGVARFYTEMVQSDLLLRSAKLTHAKRQEIARKNDIEDFDTLLQSQNNPLYPILQRNKSMMKYVEEFPLQSLETSPELSAIFAEPEFGVELFSKQGVKDKIEKLASDVVENAVSDQSPEYKTYVIKTYANEILRYIFAASLNSDCVKNGEIDLDKLKDVTLRSIAPKAQSPEDERYAVIKRISKNIDEVNIASLSIKIKNELQNVSLQDFKESETLILQANAGLNWRFDAAKDIGDLDSVRSGNKDFIEIWDSKDGVVDFWHDFIQEVKEYNPSSYIVAELTNLWDFYNAYSDTTRFDKNGFDPNKKERDFLVKISATTNSNYGQYFNKLSCFIGTNPENYETETGDDKNNPVERAGNLLMLKNAVEKVIKNSQPTGAILTHEFFDNHDKPRLLHAMPLDMKLFLAARVPEEYQQRAQNLTGRDDYQNINPMALAVGFAMEDTINKTDFSDEDKSKLKKALVELVNGRMHGSVKNNYKRAKSFGTKPYEITIREMFKRAGMEENLDENVKDFHVLMLKPYMEYEERLWQVMNAIVGIPTLFNGTEFAQTGYETPSKNVYVDNRNQILHGLKKDPRYKDMYDRMFASASLYQKPQMSAIRDGFPIICNIDAPDGSANVDFDYTGLNRGAIDWFANRVQRVGGYDKAMEILGDKYTNEDLEQKLDLNGENDNHNNFRKYVANGKLKELCKASGNKNISQQAILPIFKYDDKGSQVLSLITNNGVPHGKLANDPTASDGLETLKFKSISVVTNNTEAVLPEGTKLKKKVYVNGQYETEKYADSGEDIVYEIKENKLQRRDGKEIELEDTVVHFFVDRASGTVRGPQNAIVQQ